MAECFYCEKDNEKRKALMLDVCELPYSIVYLFRDQKNKGRCVVAFKGSADRDFLESHGDEIRHFTDLKSDHWAYGEIAEAVNAHEYRKTESGEEWTE